MTHLAAGVLTGGRAAFTPLMGAGGAGAGAGAGALVTAPATRPCPGPPLPCFAPLLATLVSADPFTPAGLLTECLAAFSFSASCRSCHHFCSEQTGGWLMWACGSIPKGDHDCLIESVS